MKAVLPALDLRTRQCSSPHVVLLGAGASRAATPQGDRSGHVVPLLKELAAVVEIEKTLEEHAPHIDFSDFEAGYDELATSGNHPGLIQTINKRIWTYFRDLNLPDAAGIYDFLLLSLREKDLIASFNWDSLLLQAYRRHARLRRLPQIVFLHGNVAMGVCSRDRVKGYLGSRCRQCGQYLERTQLLYPVRQKNYTDSLIDNEWQILRDHLKQAYFLTIFGYAAPETDVEARALLFEGWKDNPTFEFAQIEIIDLKPRRELVSRWREFFCRNHFSIHKRFSSSYLFRNPRRSCEAFAMATLQCDPWRDNPFPRFRRVNRLQDWIRQLLEEESAGVFSGNPCP